MGDPILGVVMRRVDDEARPALQADMSTLLFIGPMPEADNKRFSLNKPVFGYSNSSEFTRKMGSAGFIPDAVRGVNDQLGEAQFAAQVIVVRTAPGVNADPAIALRETMRNIVGDSLLGTGLWAGLLSAETVQHIPRLWSAPGYTSVLANSLGSIEQTTRGEGYEPGRTYQLTITGGGTNVIQGTATVTADGDGVLEDAVITTYGSYYTEAPTVTLDAEPAAGGTEAVFEATADQLANPVCAALDAVLSQYLAHAAVESAGTSQSSDEQFRETINSQRIIPLVGGVKVQDPVTGLTVTRPLAPRFLGALVRRDHETGGPFHSACNQPIRGILGPARSIRFNISDDANEGQQLLKANMGVLVRGDVGNDFAIASGGFIILATDNAGDDPIWQFYNQTRGRDFIHLTMIRTLRYYVGKFNISGHTIQAVVNTMDDILSRLKANDNILGYTCGFQGSFNTASEIRLGNITVSFAAEEPAPLRKITGRSSRYRPAVDALISQLESRLNLAA